MKARWIRLGALPQRLQKLVGTGCPIRDHQYAGLLLRHAEPPWYPSLASVHPTRSAVEDEATITPYVNGPYIVRGNFRITDQEGNTISWSSAGS